MRKRQPSERRPDSRVPQPKTKPQPPRHSLHGLGNQDASRLFGGTAAGQGKSLEPGTRARMESAFGASFSDVRVHTGADAGQQAGRLNADAFTAGEDIGFASGQYRPGTPFGDALLAHELAHVLQQRAGRREDSSSEGERGLMEQHADRAAAGVLGRMAGVPGAPVAAPGATGLGLQLARCGGNKQAEGPGKAPEQAPDEFASPWKAEAVAAILSKNSPQTVQFLLDEGWTVIRFEKAYDKWQHDDGSVTENEIPGLRGNTRRDKKEIRLRNDLTNRQAASTLFHETRHAMSSDSGLEDEINARIATEEFHIKQGWPESSPGYRKPDGTVDTDKIRKNVTGSQHYNPTGKKRIGRRYEGEKVEGGWKKP